MADRKTDDPNEDLDYVGVVRSAYADAVLYVDTYIAPQRDEAEQYYKGEPFGDEDEGRSQVVLTVVRDTILAMLPSLLRVFYGTEKPLEFAPRTAAAILNAEQATDYVDYVFNVDNPGFTLMHSAFKDALLKKTGIFKWGTEKKLALTEESFSGIDAAQVQQLAADEGVEIVSAEESGQAVDPATMQPIPTFDVRIRRVIEEPRQVVEVLPPEEFIIARNARSLDTADFIGHRRQATLSELVSLGYDREEIEMHGSASGFDLNQEAQTRNEAIFENGDNPSTDETLDRYTYVEAFIRADRDGDGYAELRKVCFLGDNAYVLHDELADEVKFAVLCPDPEPHMVIGSSIHDQVKDIQHIQSHVLRKVLDSLASNIDPRTVVVEGQVNIDDVLNPEQGAIIRATQPGMVQTLDVPFVGQAAMSMIGYLDDVRAARTGISKASQGLDPDVLQSTTQAAVTATMSAAQERLEMIARIFAETGIKRLFCGLLREIVRHQDRPRTVRLRNSWQTVDPRSWDAEMDMIVNVGLGNGSTAQKTQLLMAVAQDQEKIIASMGPDNPFTDLKQFRDTKVKILEMNGLKDGARYYKEITPESVQKLMATQAQQQQAAQAQNPAVLLAQVEAEKIKKDIEIAGAREAREVAKQKAADDLERDKLDADIWLRATEMNLKYGTQLQVEQLYAMIQRDRDAAKTAIDIQKAQQPAAPPQMVQ